MSFILVPTQGARVQINGWNWRPTLELIRAQDIIDEETFERMSAQGCGGGVDAERADRIADAVEATLLGMRPGERMLHDLSVTAEPKSVDVQTDDIYSASYEWLQVFVVFCRSSGGFTVV